MKKQTNLLEFEYLPEQDKCVIRAVHRPEFEYGHIGSLSSVPYVTTTPDARIPLRTIELVMEFVQECKKQPRQFEGTPMTPPTKGQVYWLIHKGWVQLLPFDHRENELVQAAMRHTEDRALLALASLIGLEEQMETILKPFDSAKIEQLLRTAMEQLSNEELRSLQSILPTS